jgi:opacity protein-like surface antigen
MALQFSTCAFAAFGIISTAALDSEAFAQTPGNSGYVGVRSGANIERAEDGLAGESVGVGVDAGLPLTTNWNLDFELWVPAFFKAGDTSHRDLLFNVSAIRALGEDAVRPFVLVGVGFGSVQTRSSLGSFSSSTTYAVFGGGVQVPVSDRIAVIADVRVNFAPIAAVIVRPAVGIRVRF